jgi:diguanylate cyclase (GGDEF)-like protein/PAS domain S-box-containing protein
MQIFKSPRQPISEFAQYLMATAIFLLALILRLAVLPVEAGVAFLTFYPAMVISFYLYGVGPGVLTAALGGLAGYFIFTPPYWSMDISVRSLVPLSVFLFSAYLVSRIIREQLSYSVRLAESAQEIEDLYDHAPCGYHSLGLDGTYLRINETELGWLGCKREEVVGKMKPTDFFTPAGKATFRLAFPDFIRAGHTENLEFDLIGKNGVARRVSLSATAIRDDQGNFLRSRSILYDITEMKHAEEQLHQVMLEQHVMLDNELIGIVRLQGRHMLWTNAAMHQIFGYGPGELIGKSVRMLYPDDASYDRIGSVAYPVLQTSGIYRDQIEMRRKDGTPIWMDVSGSMMPGGNGESLWMLLDVTQIKQQSDVVEQIAFHDILTGLPNRLLIFDRLGQLLAQAERSRQMLAVCYLDLDGFKPINDKFGHDAGDKVLIEVAHRMERSVRVYDTIGRIGGDEFVLLITNMETAAEYLVVLQRLIEAINRPIMLDEKNQVAVGASIGIALFPMNRGDPEMMLHYADQAMYLAKHSGRNRICMHEFDVPDCVGSDTPV